jgi:hypothetical protein
VAMARKKRPLFKKAITLHKLRKLTFAQSYALSMKKPKKKRVPLSKAGLKRSTEDSGALASLMGKVAGSARFPINKAAAMGIKH